MRVPHDDNKNVIQLVPSSVSLARTVSSTISSATSITLNAATTFLEVAAISQAVYLRYAAGVTTSAFDEFILANSVRHYIVPSGVTVVSVLEDAATAKVIVIEK